MRTAASHAPAPMSADSAKVMRWPNRSIENPASIGPRKFAVEKASASVLKLRVRS